MAGLSGGVRAVHDDLQPLQSLEPAGCLAGRVLCPERLKRGDRSRFDGRHPHQGTPLGSRCKRGAFDNAIGRSRGGRTTKVHALSDEHGRPRAFAITPGQVRDLTGAASLLTRLPTPKQVIADRSYDAKRLRNWLVERGCQPVIPPNPTRKHPHTYDPVAYRERNLIKRMFCRIKDFRRIATRYDKRADTDLSAIFIVATLIWWLN